MQRGCVMTLALSLNKARERAAVSAMPAKSEAGRNSLVFWARTALPVKARTQVAPTIHPIRVIERIGSFLFGHRDFWSNAQQPNGFTGSGPWVGAARRKQEPGTAAARRRCIDAPM